MTGIAGAVAAIGLALAIAAPRAAARAAGLALCLAGWATLVLVMAPGGHAGLYAVLAACGAAATAALAALFVRVPWALPLLALACVPFRVDVDVADARGRLLVPLYLVVAGAALALLWRPRRGRDLGLVAWPLALLVALAGVSPLWSDDTRAGGTALALYVLPFGLLALALARLSWSVAWSRTLAIELGGLGAALAVAGGVQYLTRDVTSLVGGSVVSDWYYPVGPLFDDPGDYARFLAVALVVVLGAATRTRDLRAWVPALAAAVVIWLGLVVAFSQPALAAVAVAAVAILVGVWAPRALVPVAVVLTLGAAVAGLFAALRGDVLRVPGPDLPASVHGAIETALDHPLGLGLGTSATSHAAVATAVELGGVGLLLLAAVVVAALGALRRARGPAAFALVAALVVIAVDSTFRGELMRDPLFWGALGLAAAAARPVRPTAPGRRASAAPYNRPLDPVPARRVGARPAGRDRIGVRLRRVPQARAQPDR